jgi:hypothetical protein
MESAQADACSQKKLTKQEFENAAEEDIQSKVRYDYLNITGANVSPRFSKGKALTFS